MAGVIQAVEWKQRADELYARYCSERDVERRKRLQALWRLRQGQSATQAAHEVGIGRRTLVRWLSWYRVGGLEAVLSRVPGHGAQGAACRLSEAQKEELLTRCSEGQFRSTPEVRDWVEAEWGVRYRRAGMYDLLARHQIHPKVPRPQAEQADPQRQEGWKRGGSAGH